MMRKILSIGNLGALLFLSEGLSIFNSYPCAGRDLAIDVVLIGELRNNVHVRD